MSPILLTALIIGRPTMDGNICAGKFAPAYPHFTNYKSIMLLWYFQKENFTKYKFKRYKRNRNQKIKVKL